MITEKNDLHFAAQAGGQSGSSQIRDLKKELLNLKSFKDDSLAFAGARFPTSQEPFKTSCPIIEIHVSKHPKSKKEIVSGLKEIDELMEKYDKVAGYAHGEVRKYDVLFESNYKFNPHLWRLKTFSSQIRSEGTEKKWDIHATVPRAFLEEYPQANDILAEEAGFYYIDVKKRRNDTDGIYRVYTIQGVNEIKEGEKVFDVFLDWARKSKIPRVEMCLEKTVRVHRYNSPEIVPPTIDRVDFRI